MFWWRRKEREQDLERELLSHLEAETAEQQESGILPEEARHAARRAFGNLTTVAEEVGAAWGWTRLKLVARDAGYIRSKSSAESTLAEPAVSSQKPETRRNHHRFLWNQQS